MFEVVVLTYIFMIIRSQQKLIKIEIKRQKTVEEDHGFQFSRIKAEKEDFDIFIALNEIFRHTKQSTENTVINKISRRLFG